MIKKRNKLQIDIILITLKKVAKKSSYVHMCVLDDVMPSNPFTQIIDRL